MGISALSEHYTTIQNARIRYFDEGSGPVLLLVHGFGVSAETWRHNIPALASKFRVLAPDLIGHGKSDRPVDAPYSVTFFIDSLQLFLKILGVKDYRLLGHSMGGLIVIRMALEDEENVKGLVLEDSAGLGGGPSFGTRMAFLSYLLRMSLFGVSEKRVRGWLQRGFYSDPSKITDEAVKRALDSWKDKEYQKVARRSAGGLRRSERAVSRLIGELKIPTLVLWGEKDQQIPMLVAFRAGEKIPKSRVEILKGCGHASHTECSEEFNQRVLTFLSSLN